jgi:hypothetical protein
MIVRITIESQAPGDSRTMFRLRLDEKVIAEDLTAVQAHLLVGEALNRMTLPRSEQIEGASPREPFSTLRPAGAKGLARPKRY